MRIQLTILTDPVPQGTYWFTERIKGVARRVRNTIRPRPIYMRSFYRGHFAVTRSLVEGLYKIGANANYNPGRISDVGEVVVVLSGLSALRQAIDWKRTGVIRWVLAGPNVVDFPSDAGSLICAPEVDICITPGPLTCNIYLEDCPQLSGRCAPWPAGVDTAYWAPSRRETKRAKILIYDKLDQGPTDTIEAYRLLVEQRGYKVDIIRYGSYTQEQYKNLLQQSELIVGFTTAESQGITWAEAWSSDVPTLLWYKDKHSYNHPRSKGRVFASSTAPYLTEDTGRFFRNIEEFENAFSAWESNPGRFMPRQWVLENMSDEVCARRLCELADVKV